SAARSAPAGGCRSSARVPSWPADCAAAAARRRRAARATAAGWRCAGGGVWGDSGARQWVSWLLLFARHSSESWNLVRKLVRSTQNLFRVLRTHTSLDSSLRWNDGDEMPE